MRVDAIHCRRAVILNQCRCGTYIILTGKPPYIGTIGKRVFSYICLSQAAKTYTHVHLYYILYYMAENNKKRINDKVLQNVNKNVRLK